MQNELFKSVLKQKQIVPVTIGKTIITDYSHAIHIILGPCSSVVLCGLDDEDNVWLGANHMIRSREKNTDVALKDFSTLRNKLLEKHIHAISCLGVFGGSYKEGSVLTKVAKKNIESMLETLSLFHLPLEVFEIGYRQDIVILYNEKSDSFMINDINMDTNKTKLSIIPGTKVLLH